jgi:hypothetical protein
MAGYPFSGTRFSVVVAARGGAHGRRPPCPSAAQCDRHEGETIRSEAQLLLGVSKWSLRQLAVGSSDTATSVVLHDRCPGIEE